MLGLKVDVTTPCMETVLRQWVHCAILVRDSGPNLARCYLAQTIQKVEKGGRILGLCVLGCSSTYPSPLTVFREAGMPTVWRDLLPGDPDPGWKGPVHLEA